MKIKINEGFLGLKDNYLFSEVARRVRDYVSVHPEEAKRLIRLGIGDVTLPLAPCVVAAARRATAEMGESETFRGYAPERGYAFLLEAVARRYASLGVSLDEDEIFISDGAKSDAGNIADILGDSPVYIPDPVYPVYADSSIIAGRRIRMIEGNRENLFLPMPDGIAESGAVFFICSPNNPTGAVYSRKQLEKWVDFARDTGSLIIYDSAYESFIDGDFPHSIYEIDGAKQCAVEICSLSKSAGFTGMRCAWTVVPSGLSAGDVSLNALWARRQATKFNGVAYIIQRAAEAALSDEGRTQCAEAIRIYKENAHILSAPLDEKGIFYTGGRSSPYIWMRCPGGMRSWDFFDLLLEKAQIVGTPGEGFGSAGRGPTTLMSERSTLMNCGSSSKLSLRSHLPTRVIRGSSAILNTGPVFSLSSLSSLL